MPQDTVTVTGSDRTKLLADLTVRLGRVEVVEEHQVQLADGSEGWQLTVSHQPFVASAPPVAQAPEPAQEPTPVAQPAAAPAARAGAHHAPAGPGFARPHRRRAPGRHARA